MGQDNNPKTQIRMWTRGHCGTNVTNADTGETNQTLSKREDKGVMEQSRARIKKKYKSKTHDNRTSLTTHSAIHPGENDDFE